MNLWDFCVILVIVGDMMKTTEAYINGKKIEVVMELEDGFVEELLLDEKSPELEKTADLTKTLHFMMGDSDE